VDVVDLWYALWNSRTNLVKEVEGHRIVVHADFGGDEPVFVVGCESCRRPGKAYTPIAKVSVYRVDSVERLFEIIENAIQAHLRGSQQSVVEEVSRIAQRYGYTIQRAPL